MPAVLTKYGDFLTQQHRLPEAEKCFERGLQLYDETNKTKSTRMLYQQEELDAARYAILVKLGDLLKEQNQFERAEQIYKRAIVESEGPLGRDLKRSELNSKLMVVLKKQNREV